MTPTEGDLARGLLEAMSEALYVVDRDRTITYWNPAAEELTGFAAEEVLGRRCRDGVLNHVDESGASMCGSRCPLLGTLLDGQVRETVAYAHHRDGHRMPVAVKAAPLRDPAGHIYGAVEVFHDDSRCQGLAERAADAEQDALTDPLTRLPNRRMLERALQRLHNELTQYSQPFAVLFADIDHFKAVNDQHGHPAGDAVLRLVASTLRDCTRPGDVVGRWGGEEFLLLAPVRDVKQARTLAERMRRLVGASWIDVEGRHVKITLSIGVAVSRSGEPSAETVARADAAMLVAKTTGRNRTAVAGTNEQLARTGDPIQHRGPVHDGSVPTGGQETAADAGPSPDPRPQEGHP